MIEITRTESELNAAKKAHQANIKLLQDKLPRMKPEIVHRALSTAANLQQQVREIDAMLMRIENRREVA